MTTNDDSSAGKARFPAGHVIATDEQITDDGATLHFMRLSPELEALIRGMAEDVRALRQEVRFLRTQLGEFPDA